MYCRKNIFFKSIFLTILTITLISSFGCRRSPSKQVKYYESEKIEMRAARERALNKENETTYIKDGYPWEGKKDRIKSVPCDINKAQHEIQHDLDYLGEMVHGKKKCKCKLRY